MNDLPVESLLAGSVGLSSPPPGLEIGRSQRGRTLHGYRLGRGPLRVSLIAGCHADEPVGPAMLRRLVGRLAGAAARDPLLEEISWWIVPHVNPDGEEANAPWTERRCPAADHRGQTDEVYDPGAYLRHVDREPPGDDLEFGFPRSPGDDGARPEARAVAAFLSAAGAPFHLHASFHGMGFAPGPWFLLEPSWADRTGALRDSLREKVAAMGYPLADPDRRGEKGFVRIDRGFTTRPDSEAMRRHFLERDEPETAELFRPSSMEYVRSLGGDPLTLVSEMPLFLLATGGSRPSPVGTEGRLRFQAWLRDLLGPAEGSEAVRRAAEAGVRGMPLRDQMRLQLAFLDQALKTVRMSLDDGDPNARDSMVDS